LSNCTYYSVESLNGIFCPDNEFKFHVLHLNIRSFRKNFDELSAHLDLLNVKFCVLVFTETWFSQDCVVEIDGYSSSHSYRSSRTGGGVSVYVARSFRSHVKVELTLNNDLFESCCVRVSSGDNVMYIAVHDNNMVYVLGDFNIDALRSDSNSHQFLNLMKSHFLRPLINVPTRVTDNSCSLIDNIWTNDLTNSLSGVITLDVTDHFPIFVSLPLSVTGDKILKRFRDHSDVSLNALRDGMAEWLGTYNVG